jgi:hypothetical protein
LFDSPRAAFEEVLATRPLIVAIGEAHAPKGVEGVASSAKRFMSDLLPAIEGKASDLVLELMAPPSGCEAKTARVREKHKVVTEKQAETNQSDYVALGNEARRRGIVPDLLRPTCADMRAIDEAGADAIMVSLEAIARLTKTKVVDLVSRNEKLNVERIVVTYGGAMHNDLKPPPERAAWSFGPELSAKVGGRYVELDVFVPEFVQDTESWRKLEWYPYFARESHPDKATLFRPRPGSYVLILPR